MFCKRQIFVNACPGCMTVSSGTVTSIGLPAPAWSQVSEGIGVLGGAVGAGGDGVLAGAEVVTVAWLGVGLGVVGVVWVAACVNLASTVWYAWVTFMLGVG